MSTLYIPNSIALRNFDSVFKNNSYIFSDKKVEIEFHPAYVAMHPIGFAFYAALADEWAEKEYEVTASMNRKISSIPFLQRMGLFSVLGFVNPKEIIEHEECGRFIPLRKIRNSEELNEFMRTIDPLLHTDSENSKCIKHVFGELLRNVIEHSNCKNGANVCATYNLKRKKISIGISDNGIGLFNSLVRCHPIKNDKEALIKALTPGISGATSKIGGTSENAGAGLFYTKCIAQTARNHMLIYSGNSYYKLLTTPKNDRIVLKPNPIEDRCKIKEDIPCFKGTLVGIDINIDNNSEFNNLMSMIGKTYRDGINKSKKDYFRRINFI